MIAPESYNKFVRSLRDLVVGRGLVASLWSVVKERCVGLISSADTLQSNVSPDQANKFLEMQDVSQAPQQQAPPPPPLANNDDYDDLVTNIIKCAYKLY